jgi:hypothetical protein
MKVRILRVIPLFAKFGITRHGVDTSIETSQQHGFTLPTKSSGLVDGGTPPSMNSAANSKTPDRRGG